MTSTLPLRPRELLFHAVIEFPDDDIHRLRYAEYLEENGDASDRARAEFIRVQVELARIGEWREACNNGLCNTIGEYDTLTNELRRRERELWNESRLNGATHPWFGQMGFRHTANWLTTHNKPEITIPIGRNRERSCTFDISRGFINSLTCSWQDWLANADKLVWWPEATDECQNCEGAGEFTRDNSDPPYGPCPNCGGNLWTGPYYEPDDHGWDKGTGRVPRPMPPTCQPIETVRMAEIHPSLIIERFGDLVVLAGHNGAIHKFTRLKCSACDGQGVIYIKNMTPHAFFTEVPKPCPTCHGRQQNRWHYETWPRVVFEMPESS